MIHGQLSGIFRNSGRYFTIFSFIAVIIVLSPVNVCGQDELTIFDRWKEFDNVSNALYHEIANEAYRHLNKRERKLADIQTSGQYRDYVRTIKSNLDAAFGPMPKKTPLNSRVTGTFEHEGKSETYQHVILNLALKGFLVFAIDPVGQGERLQYVNEADGSSIIGGPTKEHSYAGLQYLLLGRTMAMVRLWDCIRAVDYLTGRPDVDPGRIGAHGRSGGGTMSSYLGAMDSRIAAAAPECYITGFRRLLQSIGPQDGEQNLLAQISGGLDHGDFLIARENRPTLVVTTTRDFFSIQGARETVRSITTHKVLQSEMNLSMVEDDAPHQSTKNNREKVYEFFMNAFDVQAQSMDVKVTVIDEKVLQVTKTGQTETSGSKTIHEFIREDAVEIINKLENNRKNNHDFKERIIDSARHLSGYYTPGRISEPVFCGRINREGYGIEKYIVSEDGKIPLPVLFFVPERTKSSDVILYINPEGKGSDAAPDGKIEALVNHGYCVLAPDLPGYGELSADTQGGDSVFGGVSYNLLFGAQLIGRSIIGIQAEYIVRACRFLDSREDIKPYSITGIAKGIAGPALLHAAVLDTTITSVALMQSPVSWVPVINERYYDYSIGSTIVPSALISYDLIDLLCVLAPRKLLIFKPAGGDNGPMKAADVSSVNSVLGDFYAGKKVKYTLIGNEDQRSFGDVLSSWLSY